MAEPTTLVEMLEGVVHLEEKGYSHLTSEKEGPLFISYREMNRRIQRVAAALQARGLKKGDRLGLILPDSAQFIDCIFGAMVAGVIPVPVYPPLNLGQLETYLSNTIHTLDRAAGCRLVLTDGRVRPILGRLMSESRQIESIEDIKPFLKETDEEARPERVEVLPEDIAFLQFTSGSTSRPKGVMVTHANLIANIQCIGGEKGLQITPEDRAVSWLPLYHDMGLIGFVFTPIYYQTQGVLFLSPLLFLKRPATWLRHLSEQKATITFAPNFAFGLCTTRIKEKEIEGVDLSSLRVAGCGAEPIQYATLRDFGYRFAAYGFRSTAFLPCYGMAEHTLAVTFVELEDDLHAERVEAEALAQGEARLVPEPEEGEDPPVGVIRVVDCGRSFPRHEVKIIDPQGESLGERKVGQILLAGPSVMKGYYGAPEQTAEALRDGWLYTGDLGYLAEGRLFVCGRVKDLIIIHGRNYHPQDIEWQASQVEGVRKGNVVAFGLEDPEAGRERVVVAAEIRAPEEEAPGIRREVQAQILESLSLKVDEVLLLPPGSLPKTSSGKLQRTKTREMFLSTELGHSGQATAWNLVKHLASSRWNYIKSSLAQWGTKD